MGDIKIINKKEEVFKPLEELVKEGWIDTLQNFSHFKRYKKGNERILYDSKRQIIYHSYSV